MAHEPWDGYEPITDALARHGLREVFQLALDQRRKATAVEVLCRIGAERPDADRMVDILLPDMKGETP